MFRDSSVFAPGLFEGRRALVTGGGSGIGLAIAGELRGLGADVLICSRSEEKLQGGIARLESIEADGALGYHPCNIREEDSIEACVDAMVERFGGIDLLVNNAGGQFPSPALGIRRKGWDAVIETNLTGTFQVSQIVARKALIPAGGGAIVNIIAQMWSGFPMMAHTGAARAGVDNLTKTLAFEWSPLGIRVNAVAPGVIHSSGIDSYDEEFQSAFEDSIEYIPAGRLGTPREIAAAVCFLLSPAAQFITGTTLNVDGGEPLYGSASAGQVGKMFQSKPTDDYR